MLQQAMRLSCCVLLLLATAGNAQAAKKTAKAPGFEEAEAVLDHFLCYLFPGDAPALEGVRLKDQFVKEPAAVTVKDRNYLCTPADKDESRRKHPGAHLVCYLIEDRVKPPSVRVGNQLHPNQLLLLAKAELICVPSGKEEVKDGTPPGSTPPKIPEDLDHFKCYVHVDNPPPPRLHKAHTFRDQFNTYELEDFQAKYVCNPVTKHRPGKPTRRVLHERAHLVCYTVRPQIPNKTARMANQFEADATARVAHLELACIPSTKRIAG